MSNYEDDRFSQDRDATVQMQAEFERTLKVICSWCSGVMIDGGDGITHSICKTCAMRVGETK